MLFPNSALQKLSSFNNYKAPFLLIILRLLNSKSNFKKRFILQVNKKL
jgi:hypothetical protein